MAEAGSVAVEPARHEVHAVASARLFSERTPVFPHSHFEFSVKDEEGLVEAGMHVQRGAGEAGRAV